MKTLAKIIVTFITSTLGLAITAVAVVGVLLSQGIDSYKLYNYTPQLSSVITDRNGEVLRYVYSDQHRIWVPLEEISPHLVNATVAMEDHRFYDHFGIDFVAIARAAKSTLIDGDLEGGSTLTQQYVKNAFLTPKRTLTRKIREARLAILLEQVNSKDSIIEKYLNQVSYGDVYHGVETASRYYFGKSAIDLTIAEAAILASMTKAPSRIAPNRDREYLINRQHIVLEKMAKQGYITQAEKDEALKQELTFVMKAPQIKAPHFTQRVIDVMNQEYDQAELDTQGLTITTTLDYQLQQQAQQSVAQTVADYQNVQVSNGAALVMDPNNGQILAWVGSKDYFAEDIPGKFDVLTAYRQPGSALKPLLYSLALKQGYTAATVINDTDTTYELTELYQEYKPVNYDEEFHGPVSIRQALANSYNIPATRMLVALKLPTFISHLDTLGIDYIDPSRVGISLALGGYEIRPVDLATAYTSLANQGAVTTPTYILSWTDTKGDEHQTETITKSVIDPSVSYIISDILTDNRARAQAFGTNSLLHIPETPVAVKTGTSNDKRDNWAVGYTPDFLVLSWVGNNDNTPMAQATSGLTGATPIWRQLTDTMLERKGSNWYDQPESVVSSQIHQETGGAYCDQGTEAAELFVDGTQPQDCREVITQGTHVLYEERNGQDIRITELSQADYELYQKDPFAIIEKHSDILQADETPTPIFVETNTSTMEVEDPLFQLAGDRSVIEI